MKYIIEDKFKLLRIKSYNINDNINIIKKALFKILFILLEFFLISYFLLLKIKNIKVCLCTLGKKENRYAREFVEHYKQYGVDKIFIYDNNDLKDEKFETVLSDYIKEGLVEIKDYRGKNTIQINIYRDCYKRNYKIYDWFIIVDMDEYIFLRNFKKVKTFLNDKRFMKCYLIYLNRAFHTDNGQIYYKNISLFERFPKFHTRDKKIKSIVRGHILNIRITSIHGVNILIFFNKDIKNIYDYIYFIS